MARRQMHVAGIVIFLFMQSARAQTVPPAFAATVTVKTRTVGNNGKFRLVDELRGTLHFNGAHRWRFDSLSRSDGTTIEDFFIADDQRREFYKFLAHPPIPDVFYHEYGLGLRFQSIPEAYGLDSWAMYSEPPCSPSRVVICEKLKSEDVHGNHCDKWRLSAITESGDATVTRTVWIDQSTGLTLKVELIEKAVPRQPKALAGPEAPPLVLPTDPPGTAAGGAGMRGGRTIQASGPELVSLMTATFEVSDLRQSPQNPALFDIEADIRPRPTVSASGLANSSGFRSTSPRETASADIPYTFRAQSGEVLTDVLVRDAKGRLVTDLHKGDFRVFADGEERPIEGFWFDEAPIAVALVVDTSPSMSGEIDRVKKTAGQVLSRLKPQDQVALFALHTSTDILAELSLDRSEIGRGLASLHVTNDRVSLPWFRQLQLPEELGNATDIVNALFVSVLYLQIHAPDMRRVIILISDNNGVSWTVNRRNNRRDELDLIDAALLSQTVIYDLRIGNFMPPGPEIEMGKVTEVTGGEMMASGRNTEMLDEVVAALRKRYLLSFRPAQTKPDGRLHTIEVQLADRFGQRARDYRVFHRHGYRTAQIDVSEPLHRP